MLVIMDVGLVVKKARKQGTVILQCDVTLQLK